MATQITASLPTLNFPLEADYPKQEDWAEFSAVAEENFGILGGDWSTQMQLWKTQANAMSIELNNNADIAQAVANYQGDWVSQGYTLGQTVSVNEIYYVCKLNHATAQNPTAGGSIYWNLAIGNWNLKADKAEIIDKAEIVDKINDQSIDGIKTFVKNPLVPTPTIGDNSTKTATTAFVNAEILNDVGIANSPLVKTALNASGTAPIYACRAWVNFNGTGTVAIRASGNVSSVTDNGVGHYTVNFSTATPDVNYSVPSTISSQAFGNGVLGDITRTTTAVNVRGYENGSTTPIDCLFVELAVFR